MKFPGETRAEPACMLMSFLDTCHGGAEPDTMWAWRLAIARNACGLVEDHDAGGHLSSETL
jgi:hypothetical protein